MKYFLITIIIATLYCFTTIGCNQISGINDIEFSDTNSDTATTVEENILDSKNTDSQTDSSSANIDSSSIDANTDSAAAAIYSPTETDPCAPSIAAQLSCDDNNNIISVDKCGNTVDTVQQCSLGNICILGECRCPAGWTGENCKKPVLYVNNALTNAQNNEGKSWEDALSKLNDALVLCSIKDECEIWVAKGVYLPGTERTSTFQMKENVHIYGGFNGTETLRAQRSPTTNVTILTGDINGNDDADFDYNEENVYHVVTGANNATLDGFTITHGNANGSSPHNDGGGMYNENVSISITNCIFAQNFSKYRGGAMHNNASSLIIFDNQFIQNRVHSLGTTQGGAISNENSTVSIHNTTFSYNIASHDNDKFPSTGGAISNASTTLTISNTHFIENGAARGGAISGSGSNLTIVSSTFNGNNVLLKYTKCTDIEGGAIFNKTSTLKAANCTFTNNASEGSSSALAISAVSIASVCEEISVTNCTFINDAATATTDVIGTHGVVETNTFDIQNCIFWNDNQTDDIKFIRGTATAKPIVSNCLFPNSCESNNTVECAGENITGDPQFVNPKKNNFRLGKNSPAIDSGNNNFLSADIFDMDEDQHVSESIPFDIAGNQRIIDGNNDETQTVDIGAYEYQH